MELVHKLEKTIGDLFKGAPKLSDNTKETLVKIWPWLALIGGLAQLWTAWWLWDVMRAADVVSNTFGGFVGTYTVYSATDKAFIYIGTALLVLTAILLLVAFPKLQKREKSGWDLLFITILLNLVYGVANLFISGRGFGDLFISLIVSAIGFWLLFATRDKYKGAKAEK